MSSYPYLLTEGQRSKGRDAWYQKFQEHLKVHGEKIARDYENSPAYRHNHGFAAAIGASRSLIEVTKESARCNEQNHTDRREYGQLEQKFNDQANTDVTAALKTLAKADCVAARCFPGQLSPERVAAANHAVEKNDITKYHEVLGKEFLSHQKNQQQGPQIARDAKTDYTRNLANNPANAKEHIAAKKLIESEKSAGGERGRSAENIAKAEQNFEKHDKAFEKFCDRHNIKNAKDIARANPDVQKQVHDLFNKAVGARHVVNVLAEQHVKKHCLANEQNKTNGNEQKATQAEKPREREQQQPSQRQPTAEQSNSMSELKRIRNQSRAQQTNSNSQEQRQTQTQTQT